MIWKKLALLLSLSSSVALAQFTSVTATISDSDGQTWNNGRWSATLYNPFPANPPSIGGVPLTATQLNLGGFLSPSGVLTASMADNSQVAPTGTQWQFTICPNASTQCSTMLSAVSGASENLSTTLSSQLRQTRFPASPTAFGYLDAEIYPIPLPGGQYFNVTNSITRQWTGTTWQNVGGGGGGFPPLVVNVSNWSTGNSAASAQIQFNCNQTQLVSDTGASGFGSTCEDQVFNDYYPGAQYGFPGVGTDANGYGSQQTYSTIKSYANGIKGYLNSTQFLNGAGDINIIDMNTIVKPAWITGSDQGVSQWQSLLQEELEYTGTSTGSSVGTNDAIAVTITPTANTFNVALNSPLINTTAGTQTGTITFVSLTGQNLAIANTSGGYTVAASTVGSLAADLDVPRLVPNTTQQLSARLITFTVHETTPFTAGQYCDLVGGTFNETFKIASVGTPSGGIQSITAYLRYSHYNTAPMYCGGAVGQYVEYSSDTANGQIYLEQVYGSPATNQILVGHQIPGGFATVLQSGSKAVNVYEGGEVVGVVNPIGGIVDGQYLAIMPTPATWASGNSVRNTNNIASVYTDFFTDNIINNPYANVLLHQEGFAGYGGGLGEVGWASLNGGAIGGSWQGLTGGKYKSPYYSVFHNIWSAGLVFDNAPQAIANSAVDIDCPNCAGYLLGVGHIPAGALSQNVGIFNMGDEVAQIYLDHSQSMFHFVGNNYIHGTSIFGDNQLNTSTLISRVIIDECTQGDCPIGLGGALIRNQTSSLDSNGELKLQALGDQATLAWISSASSTFLAGITYDGTNLAIGSRGTHNGNLDLTNLHVYGTCTGCGGGGGIADIQIVLPTSTINANTCTAPATASMTGLSTTSAFSTAFASNPTAVTGWGSTGGLTFTAWPTTNTINWSICNQTGSNITPGAMTLNVGAQ
jgi:hypothetical protein